MNKFTQSMAILCCALVFVSAVLMLGNMDYEDELLEEKSYCEEVAAGIYSNYDNVECARWN